MSRNAERLDDLLKDHSVEDLRRVFDLLQENHEGEVRPFTEEQISRMDQVLPPKKMKFGQEAVGEVVHRLRKTKSSMSRLGRTQVSKFILSLSRDEIVEVVDLLLPFMAARSGKFVDTLTVDQRIATVDTLFPEVLRNAREQNRVADLLLGLYSVGRIGESLEVLGGDAR